MKRNLLIPVLIGSLLLNIPGLIPESVSMRVGFIAVVAAGGLAAALYDRYTHSILNAALNLLIAFVSPQVQPTRIICAAALFAGMMFVNIAHGPWPDVPFHVVMLTLFSAVWAAAEIGAVTRAACAKYDDQGQS